MSDLLNSIQSHLKEAMKARDTLKVSTLRMLTAAVKPINCMIQQSFALMNLRVYWLHCLLFQQNGILFWVAFYYLGYLIFGSLLSSVSLIGVWIVVWVWF